MKGLSFDASAGGWASPPPCCGQDTLPTRQAFCVPHIPHLLNGWVLPSIPSPTSASELCSSISNVIITLSEFMGMWSIAHQWGRTSTQPGKPSAVSENMNKEGIYSFNDPCARHSARRWGHGATVYPSEHTQMLTHIPTYTQDSDHLEAVPCMWSLKFTEQLLYTRHSWV